jgi:hypothetical protein
MSKSDRKPGKVLMDGAKATPTPGPWEFNIKEMCVIDADEYVICNVKYAFQEDHYTANGRLIAASPDLYAALAAVRDSFGDNEHAIEWAGRESNFTESRLGFFLSAATVRLLFAAIAKADGAK